MDKKNLLSLLNATPAVSRDFELPSGKVIPLSACTVTAYLLHIYRVFASAEAMVQAPLDAVKRLTPEEVKSVTVDGKIDSEQWQALLLSKMDLDQMFRITSREAPLVSAALVACCMGHGGDKDVEAALLDLDDDDFEAAAAEAEYRTWGDDPGPFYAKVGQRALQLKGSAIPGSRSTPSTTSTAKAKSTRTSRKAA